MPDAYAKWDGGGCLPSRNGRKPRAVPMAVASLTSLKGLLVNADGSVDVYFGPTAPPGKNWVQVSPVAWQHINLYGRYEFREQPAPVDVEEIVRELAKNPLPRFCQNLSDPT
jgi:hypothetical protein